MVRDVNDGEVFAAIGVAVVALLACWLISKYQREESGQEVDTPATG